MGFSNNRIEINRIEIKLINRIEIKQMNRIENNQIDINQIEIIEVSPGWWSFGPRILKVKGH